MPELPEVQTIVNDLNKKIRDKTITDIWTEWPKAFKRSPGGFEGFKKTVKNKSIKKVWRLGKNIIFDLSGGKEMLIHQKMTGHLLIGKWRLENGKWAAVGKGPLQERVNGYIRTMFFLSGGAMMAFSDLRKFGKILVVDKKDFEKLEDVKDIGPDPLTSSFTVHKFISLIRKKRGPIKKILMDQNVVSGIGNIYADEILFIARVHPLYKIEKLSDEDLKKIFDAVKSILKKAVKLRGTSTSDYRDTAGRPGRYGNVRLVYQREGEPCPRSCSGKIVRLKIGGRSAHFCPSCQKLK
ncbi:DNA-formamidopyrimidine glycosylase [Candidatus Azambacteria bacterium RIFCSPHIGHO2_02_FULL_45_18]|uniref:DNA-formamidopyrimidine glycosylase n=1 Tax=Candidatus Azambacteria bacterium RIFCSPLOWO2_02_FULL_44_14 TaxID=1797306 RepID=A0A1F5CBA8_9BACT|nr:MAG: DNA-formamidopyrimidine glycosylase [Candidatus Azambacteria bacterium RIFCSPHIGHO2_02_FULL_45_18]OGD40133.1 MAG: DNA-formamidopyrimidine glycosylase [Candidatus Azambacteria bacterium RIFCSPLOWO2_02_FULL_44_14]